MKLMPRAAQALINLALLCSAVAAIAAVHKLGRVKAGNARETPHKDLSEPIDGLQGASLAELKTYCGSLKRERDLAEKELEERIQAARVAEGTMIDLTKLPPPAQADIRNPPKAKDPKTAANSPEARETKRAVAEAFVRRATLTCILYSTREIQDGRAKKNVPTTEVLVKRCFGGKEVPDLSLLDCEAEKPAAPAAQK